MVNQYTAPIIPTYMQCVRAAYETTIDGIVLTATKATKIMTQNVDEGRMIV